MTNKKPPSKKQSGKGSTSKDAGSARKERWLFIFAAAGAVIGIIGLIPSFLDILHKNYFDVLYPSKTLHITSFVFSQEDPRTDFHPIAPSVPVENVDLGESQLTFDYSSLLPACLNKDVKCPVVYYYGLLSQGKQLSIGLQNEASQATVEIDRLQLKLNDYKEINSFNFIYTPALGGGGGPFDFDLREFPPLDKIPGFGVGAKPINPAALIGTVMDAYSECRQNPDSCQQPAFIEAGKPESLQIKLDFLNSLPPGWYEFELSAVYVHNMVSYHTEPIVFDVIKPEILQIWYGAQQRYPTAPIAGLNLRTGEAIANYDSMNLNNPPGRLFITVDVGLAILNYWIDLETGMIEKAGSVISPNILFYRGGVGFLSPDNLKIAYILEDHWNLDIGIGDFVNDTLINITPNTYDSKDARPAWSPSGDKLAYVKMVRIEGRDDYAQADIFVYDLVTRQTEQVTFSPDTIEDRLKWIDDTHLAFEMPQYPFLGYYTSPDIDTVLNAQVGSGILNLENDQIEFVPGSGDSTASRPAEVVLNPDPYSDLGVQKADSLTGTVNSGGWIVADLIKYKIYQYDGNGIYVGEWDVPLLAKLALWRYQINNLILFPSG